MDRTRIRAIGDIAFSGVLIGISALALYDLQGLRRSRFDYLSSAAVPRVLAWLVIILALLVAVKAIIRLMAAAPVTVGSSPSPIADSATTQGDAVQIWHVIAIATATLVYIFSIIWAVVPYSLSTAVFLVFSMALLSPAQRRNWLIILPVAIFIGGAGEYVFVHLLSLPFPRW